MTSLPLGSTHGQTTSGLAKHLRLETAHTVERRQAWHTSIAFGKHTRSKNVERGMTSPPLDSAHGRTTSSATSHHRLWKAHTVERRQVWHAIIAFGLADTVGRRKAWHAIIALVRETRSNNIERGMPSPPWDSTHNQTTSGVACYHRIWAAQTVG